MFYIFKKRFVSFIKKIVYKTFIQETFWNVHEWPEHHDFTKNTEKNHKIIFKTVGKMLKNECKEEEK